MRPKDTKLDTAPFREWLITVEDKAPGTADIYTAMIRPAIRRFGHSPTTEELEEYANRFVPQTRATFRTSWRCLVRYAKEKGMVLSDVATVRSDLVVKSSTPLAVIGAIMYLSKCLGIDFIDLTWGDVTLRNGETRLACPRYEGEYVVAAEPVATLRAWARPASDASPFLPDKPGSETPMPWSFGFHRIFRDRDPKTLPFADLPEPTLDHSMYPPPMPDPGGDWLENWCREIEEAKAAEAAKATGRPVLTSVSTPGLTGGGSKE